jgi:predicted Zn finger-like uncharacterized protein
MIIVCPSCQARYKFDETKLGDRAKARTKCAKCGAAIDIENPMLGAMTLPPGTLPPSAPQSALPAEPTTPPPAPAPPAPGDPDRTDRTKPRATPTGHMGDQTNREVAKGVGMELAKNKRYSLAVIQGAATGHIFPIDKPRVVIGRSGCDVNLDDAEASRQHAALEIFGDTAVLRDLGSTNGTFVETERIQERVIANQSEFRIGNHVLMFIVTAVE